MDTSIICSLNIPLKQLSCFLHRHDCKIQAIRGDGFCFLNAIELVLCCDYDELVKLDHMQNTILVHHAANADHYKGFHMDNVIQEADRYFKLGNCGENIFVIATTYALNLSLAIYEKGPKGNT